MPLQLQPGTRLGRYEIVALVGVGGMGEVYRARDTHLGREVALKCLPDHLSGNQRYRLRLEREAKTISQIQHPHVCTLFDFDSVDGTDFLVMEYLEGQSLSDRLRSGPMPPEEVCRIGQQVAEAIDAAHRRGLVHRDLKPGNVMLTQTGARVLDFGLAKDTTPALVDDETLTAVATAPLTGEGAILGTMPYMSPEQLEGKAADVRSDIWALGCLLYEMATGERPFQGDSQASLISSIMTTDPDPPSRRESVTPHRLDHIVRRCLEKNPEDRWQSSRDISKELEWVGRPDSSRRVTPTKQRLWAVGGVVLVAAVAGTLWLERGTSTTTAERQNPESSSVGAWNRSAKIAVLPFEHLGPAEDAFFTSGVTDEIRTGLSNIEGLAVIARSSAEEVERIGASIEEIGTSLGVEYVLDGTVRWAQDSRVRINFELIRVADQTQLWSNSFDRVLDDVFEIQDEISAQVAKQLDFSMLRLEAVGARSGRSTSAPAIRAYMRGREAWSGDSDLSVSAEAFDSATSMDSEFALAWALLSDVHAVIYLAMGDRTDARLDVAQRAADMATTLAPDLPEIHRALGTIHWVKGEFDAARREYELAVKGLPNDAETISRYAYFLWRTGDIRTSLGVQEKALVLDPLRSSLVSNFALTLMFLREYETADHHLEQAIAMEPGSLSARSIRAWNAALWKGWDAADVEGWPNSRFDPGAVLRQFDTYRHQGRFAEAEATLERFPPEGFVDQWGILPLPFLRARLAEARGNSALATDEFERARQELDLLRRQQPEDGRVLITLGLACAKLGRDEEAVRFGESGVELSGPAIDGVTGPQHLYTFAAIHSLVGDPESALDRLEEVFAIPAPVSVPSVEADMDLDSLRTHQGYRQLIERYR